MKHANRHQRRRSRKLGRRRRMSSRWTIVAILVALGLLAMTGRVFGMERTLDEPPIGSTASVASDAAPWSDESLRALLVDVAEAHGVPGMAAAIVSSDAILAGAAVGVRAAPAADQADSDGGNDAAASDDSATSNAIGDGDLWHLGSCTKAMTATLLAILVAEGELDWDQTLASIVAEHFADAEITLPERYDAVTLRTIVRMRGGFPGVPPPAAWARAWFDWRSGDEPPTAQRDRFIRSVLAALQVDDGDEPIRFEYSNEGYALAGLLAERVTGMSYESLMVERLARPIGITTMGFGAPETTSNVGMQPRGHRGDGSAVPPDGQTDNPPAIAPAGRVHMSIADWARFVQVHLRGARDGSPELGLDADAFALLHAPGDGDGPPYAGGWIARSDDRFGTTLWHNGSNTMWYAEMWLAPEHQLAVIIACNRGMPAGEEAVSSVRSTIIERLCTSRR